MTKKTDKKEQIDEIKTCAYPECETAKFMDVPCPILKEDDKGNPIPEKQAKGIKVATCDRHLFYFQDGLIYAVHDRDDIYTLKGQFSLYNMMATIAAAEHYALQRRQLFNLTQVEASHEGN